jgi:hypothetical protein
MRKKKRIDDILNGIEKREKEALAKEDGKEVAGILMHWDPELFCDRREGLYLFSVFGYRGVRDWEVRIYITL